MPIIIKPITANKDPENHWSTFLQFEGKAPIKFYMRGAISWPDGDQEGFAMMAGSYPDTKKVVIFEEFRFWTINHWLNPDNTIRKRDDDSGYHLGLIQFIQDCEAKYKCASFFIGGQHGDVIRRHSMELYRNEMLPRSIEIIEVPYVSEVGDAMVMEKFQTRQFAAANDGYLRNSFERWHNSRSAGTGSDGAINALRILLAGFEYQPWVDLSKKV